MSYLIFATDLIPKVLDGTMTQDRRPLKPQPTDKLVEAMKVFGGGYHKTIPFSRKGEQAWVREALIPKEVHRDGDLYACYKTDEEQVLIGGSAINDGVIWEWKKPYLPARFMPKWASRITIELVKDAWVERLQEISWKDVEKEGIDFVGKLPHPIAVYWSGNEGAELMLNFVARQEFMKLWNSLYPKKPEFQWEANPWVIVMEFKVIYD